MKEHGPGWDHIIDPIIYFCKKYRIPIAQIKEKFGGLRIYVDYPTDPNFDEDNWVTLMKMIASAELAASRTCEVCGEPGELRAGYWLKTLCDKHHFEREEKNKEYERKLSLSGHRDNNQEQG